MGWRKASVPKKNTPMLMRAAVLADENEIPDNHVLTVRDRVLSTDLQRIVQNNVKTDTVTLDLDGEWDGCTVYVTFNDETSQSGPWSLEWEGQPLTVPSAIGAVVGPVAVSVVGYGADGELRLVTEAAPSLLNVVKSGYVEIVDDNEENKDILSQMVAAGQAAEDAAEAANTAATSAASAASSANSAASSANTAASSANSAATKANSAAVDAQNAYDTLQPYMATIDSCANILHREVGPDTVVTADDSFPCKPVDMVVYGNTRQNLWINSSRKLQEMTIAANEDGSLSVAGTVSSRTAIAVFEVFTLKPNTQYTLSSDKVICSTSDTGFYVQYKIGQELSSYAIQSGQKSVTFTTRSDLTSANLGVVVDSTYTPGTYRVMLNEGSTAEPWCQPGLNSVGDDGSVKVVTAGKNLFVASKDAFQVQGEGRENQVIDIGFKAGGIPIGSKVIFSFDYRLSSGSGTVTIQQGASPYKTLGVSYRVLNGDNTWRKKTGAAITLNAGDISVNTYQIRLDNVSGLLEVKNFQLELGSTATDYEPPNVTTTTVDLQGHTLNALPDGTRDELHIDGGGNVVLEKRTWSDVFDGTEGWVDSTTRFGLDNGATFATTPDTVIRDEQMADTLSVMEIVSGFNGIRTFSSRWVDISITSMLGDLAGFKAWLGNNNTTLIYKLAEPQTIDLGTITPPTMAAPNVTAYVADDTPAEISLDYVRDVNIVHSRLEERVAALELASATS